MRQVHAEAYRQHNPGAPPPLVKQFTSIIHPTQRLSIPDKLPAGKCAEQKQDGSSGRRREKALERGLPLADGFKLSLCRFGLLAARGQANDGLPLFRRSIHLGRRRV